MAFINPNTISSITREEFEELKNRVNEMSIELNNIKNSTISSNTSLANDNSNQTIEETIMDSSNKFNIENVYEVRNDINIGNAKLNGIPRIEYFQLSQNKTELKEEIAKNVEVKTDESNIIDLADILDSKPVNTKSTYRVENIPTTAKTSSGHRATLIEESKLNHLKEDYYGDIKKIAV